MDAGVINQKTQGWTARAPGKERAQERILNPHNGRVAFGCDGEAPMGGWRIAPHADQIIRTRQAKGHAIARKAENAAHP